MWVEITKEAAKALVSVDCVCMETEQGEYHRSETYFTKGIAVKKVTGALSGVVQWYVQDINA